VLRTPVEEAIQIIGSFLTKPNSHGVSPAGPLSSSQPVPRPESLRAFFR
jgi:hypothetical protein